jgi:hypothetical protein
MTESNFKAHTSDELVEKIRREFPDIDAARAHRLIRIFAEHMKEATEKARIAQELRDAFRQVYGTKFGSKE